MAMIVDVINIATLPEYIVKTSFATMAFKHLRYAIGFSLFFFIVNEMQLCKQHINVKVVTF
jgi:hypothetical protein